MKQTNYQAPSTIVFFCALPSPLCRSVFTENYDILDAVSSTDYEAF